MGRHMKRLLKFCIDYPGWYPMSKYDDAGQAAMKRLADLGFLEVRKKGPKDYVFRLMPPAYEREK